MDCCMGTGKTRGTGLSPIGIEGRARTYITPKGVLIRILPTEVFALGYAAIAVRNEVFLKPMPLYQISNWTTSTVFIQLWMSCCASR